MTGKWPDDPHLCILKTEYEDAGYFYVTGNSEEFPVT